MNVTEALSAAQAAGVKITIDGDDLLLSAPAQPPAELLALLIQFKKAIITLSLQGKGKISTEGWQELFDERAGFGEFDGGLRRDQAEAQAFSCCIREWLDRNPVRTTPGRCGLCDQSSGLLRPYLLGNSIRSSNYIWLHHECSQAWLQKRRMEAVEALTVLLPMTPKCH